MSVISPRWSGADVWPSLFWAACVWGSREWWRQFDRTLSVDLLSEPAIKLDGGLRNKGLLFYKHTLGHTHTHPLVYLHTHQTQPRSGFANHPWGPPQIDRRLDRGRGPTGTHGTGKTWRKKQTDTLNLGACPSVFWVVCLWGIHKRWHQFIILKVQFVRQRPKLSIHTPTQW